VLGLALGIRSRLLLLAAVALFAPLEVVVLAFAALPATLGEVEVGGLAASEDGRSIGILRSDLLLAGSFVSQDLLLGVIVIRNLN